LLRLALTKHGSNEKAQHAREHHCGFHTFVSE
jgi:hypothetical protein